MQVHSVGDQLDGDLVAFQQGEDEARFAVVQGAFGVEEVGGDPCPGGDRRQGRRGSGGTVNHRREDTARVRRLPGRPDVPPRASP